MRYNNKNKHMFRKALHEMSNIKQNKRKKEKKEKIHKNIHRLRYLVQSNT